MRTAVVFDYPDVHANVSKAFGLNRPDAYVDPVRCAELLALRSRHRETLNLVAIRLHYAIPDPRHRPRAANAARHWLGRWQRADPRLVVHRRGRRVPGHDPLGKPVEKGVSTAVALDVSLMLARAEIDHAIVFTHRAEFVALAELVAELTDPPALEFASWQSRASEFRVKVAGTRWINKLTLYREDFERCRTHGP